MAARELRAARSQERSRDTPPPLRLQYRLFNCDGPAIVKAGISYVLAVAPSRANASAAADTRSNESPVVTPQPRPSCRNSKGMRGRLSASEAHHGYCELVAGLLASNVSKPRFGITISTKLSCGT